MNLMTVKTSVAEKVDRRVLGAFRFIDGVTRLPISADCKVTVLGVSVRYADRIVDLGDCTQAVTLLRNRSGIFVLRSAPNFENYTLQYNADNIQDYISDAIKNSILIIKLAVIPYTGYLPAEFEFELPRNCSSDANKSIGDSDDITKVVLANAPFVISVTKGTFNINDENVEVDPSNSLSDVFKAIETVTIGKVKCQYDNVNDQILLKSEESIHLGSDHDTSNFLVVCRLYENGRNIVCSKGKIAGSVFEPLEIPLFRSPFAHSECGTIVIRARVIKNEKPLGGVLVKVYRSPRQISDKPIGYGLTEWRGDICGEALVIVTGVPRYRPGEGSRVVENEQLIEFETVRSNSFTGQTKRFPDCHSLLYGCGNDLVVAPMLTSGIEPPAPPISVEACREYNVLLKMP